ncbi:hypothetical protein DFQ26_009234 [Actinomortierella ambigua]|nr:hypothetical protein DFQ26_009234 [Actinomortierella ambigua]
MSSSPPSDQPPLTSATTAPAAAASESFDDDNDYDKLNDEDWQDMPAARQSSLSATRGAAGMPTPLLLRTEPLPTTGSGSSGSQTPVHVASASDTFLGLHLVDHSHSNQPSSSSPSLEATGGPDSPTVPDSASSSSSEFSLLNPSVASSVTRSHRNSVSALSTSSDQHPSPSLMSLTPTSTVEATTTPSPSLDQSTSAGEEEGMMHASTPTGLQQQQDREVSVAQSEDNAPPIAHPEALRSTPHPLPLLAAQFDSDAGEAETVHSKRSQVSGAIASLSSPSSDTAPAASELPRLLPGKPVPSSSSASHLTETIEDKSSDEREKARSPELSSTATALGTDIAQGAPSHNIRVHRTTVVDAPESHEENDEEEVGRTHVSGESGMRHRRRDLSHGTSAPTPAETLGQYAMPGALNLELENLGLESHFAAQSRPSASSRPPAEERQCRICLGGPDETDLGRLISPCMCKGSMKYVHVECLNEWRARSPKRESHYKCDTCKYEFSFRRTSFAKYLSHPATLFILTILAFALAVFAAGFVMKLLMYLFMEEFDVPLDEGDKFKSDKVIEMTEDKIVFRPPDTLRAVFQIDSTHMVFGSLLVSIVGFLQLLVSAVLMGGGGHVFQIGGFGLGGRRRGGRGGQQGEAGISSIVLVLILVFGLFKSLYVTYRFVRSQTRKALAKAESMILEVQ